MMTAIKIFVSMAKNITDDKKTGLVGYFVTVSYSGVRKKTKVVKSRTNPIWKETFIFDVHAEKDDETFVFVIKRASRCPDLKTRSRVIGWNEISVKNVLDFTSSISLNEYELTLLDKFNKPTPGILQLKFNRMEYFIKNLETNVNSVKHNGYFIIDVYRAEGLPKMDLGNISRCTKKNQELVDCYFKASFEDAKVTTSVVKRNANPSWNERLKLPLNLPLKSDVIKLELKDEDIFTRDDLIATSFLHIYELTANGLEGCLPTFGPAFINFYGAQRRFRLLENDEIQQLNSGKVDGSAFRGRVLLQLQTYLGGTVDVTEGISSVDIERTEFFSKENKYIVRVMFESCHLLRSQDTTTLEVSFGLYGDSEIDNDSYRRPSCIIPFQPAVDNNKKHSVKHFYAPWSRTYDKPCIIFYVNAQNSFHRLHLCNVLHFFALSLKKLIEDLEKAFEKNSSQEEVIEIIQDFLLHFDANWLRFFDVHAPSDYDNELDKHMLTMRHNYFRHFSNEIQRMIYNIQSNIIDYKILQENVNEFPDLFISLYSKWQKVAFCRIPIMDILYSNVPEKRGYRCDKLVNWVLKYPYEDTTSDCRDPGHFRARLWFGADEHLNECFKPTKSTTEAFTFLAETFESEIKCLGEWRKSAPLMDKWTDIFGKKTANKAYLSPLPHWKFEGEWFTSDHNEKQVGQQLLYSEFSEDDEAQKNIQNGNIGSNSKDGEHKQEGKTKDIVNKIIQHQLLSQEHDYNLMAELTNSRTSKCLTIRRIRWRRKLSPSTKEISLPNSSIEYKFKTATFHFPDPRLYLIHYEVNLYKLVIYLYQARNLSAGDKTGFSDPFASITFMTHTCESRRVPQSLCPIWDQVLLMKDIVLYGNPHKCFAAIPEVTAEVYDHDEKGSDEYLGQVTFKPELGPIEDRSSLLSWKKINFGDHILGELSIGAELIRISDDTNSLRHENLPEDIRNDFAVEIPANMKPSLLDCTVEILCIGLRPADFSSDTLTRPFIEFLYNSPEPIAITEEIANFPSEMNFHTKFLTVQTKLPEDDDFLPSLTLRLKNRGAFGYVTVVGGCVIPNMKRFVYVKPTEELIMNGDLVAEQEKVMDSPRPRQPTAARTHKENQLSSYDVHDIDGLDWWSKYYASLGDYNRSGKYLSNGYARIQVYNSELESMEPLKSAREWVETFSLSRGKSMPTKKSKIKEGVEQDVIAELKATFRIFHQGMQELNWVPSFKNVVLAEMANRMKSIYPKVLLRVYFIRAHNLKPKDLNKQSDPYIKIQFGETESDLLESQQYNALNPVFGCSFESVVTLPRESELTIKMMDKDPLSQDDLIGLTKINLEDRMLAPCWASCGLAPQYIKSGLYSWRDIKTPSIILADMCQLYGFPQPIFHGSKGLQIGNLYWDLRGFEPINSSFDQVIPASQGSPEERLALYVLHYLNIVVPEHVETRTLIHPSHPGAFQGTLEMWLDLFPMNENVYPEMVDIAPRKPKGYELRCIVYNVYNVAFEETNLLGDEMSDVFVKAWLKGLDSKKEKTDVHYRCMNGEANFNWRFLFPFRFLHGENAIVHQTRKQIFDLHLSELALPPVLCLEIFDYDLLSRNDSLGLLELELLNLIAPSKTAKLCTITDLKQKQKPHVPRINLFQQRRIRGFWLCPSTTGRHGGVAGKIELELELLTEEEAKQRPAGFGREEPNANPHLDAPIRPTTSFNWLLSPLVFLGYLCCDRLRGHIIVIILILIAALMFYIFITKIMDVGIQRLLG